MIHTGFSSGQKNNEKKQWDLVPQRPIKRERKDRPLSPWQS
jgi:hypothetical protein